MGNSLEKCDKCGKMVNFTVSILEKEINKKPVWICINCANEELRNSANTAKKHIERTKRGKGTVRKTASSKPTKTKKPSKNESSSRKTREGTQSKIRKA